MQSAKPSARARSAFRTVLGIGSFLAALLFVFAALTMIPGLVETNNNLEAGFLELGLLAAVMFGLLLCSVCALMNGKKLFYPNAFPAEKAKAFFHSLNISLFTICVVVCVLFWNSDIPAVFTASSLPFIILTSIVLMLSVPYAAVVLCEWSEGIQREPET